MLIWIGMIVGSTIGGYFPVLWGGDLLSFAGLTLSTLGGIWLGYRLDE